MPDNPPYPKAAIKSARTGCHLNFDVVNTINPIDMDSNMISHMIEKQLVLNIRIHFFSPILINPNVKKGVQISCDPVRIIMKQG